ncbi:DUF305 domain-containing protein [Streptomyces sp. NPDC049687]|uniref:DUF305 domain-containing protein n=1 Tax=Streptomyces sp. NPDC049687 TaxID=3365596 RepID=UPI0037A8F0CF
MRHTRTLTRRAALAAASVTAALVLAACGNDGGHSTGSGEAGGHGSSSSSAGADAAAGAHNAQDVSFAQGMIPHHRQALEMAGLAAERASSAQVKDLAARVEKAQDPEIKTMSGWLKSWGEDVPTSSDSSAESMPGMDHSTSGMPGMDHSTSGMPGMMDGSDMDELEKASGADFDTMFLTMMIEHHKGAVEMATTEKAKGKYGAATSMADDIVTAQTAEIAEMNKLLGKS